MGNIINIPEVSEKRPIEYLNGSFSTTESDSFQTALQIEGSGIIYRLYISDGSIRVITDGNLVLEDTATGTGNYARVGPHTGGGSVLGLTGPVSESFKNLVPVDFKKSLLIEITAKAGKTASFNYFIATM